MAGTQDMGVAGSLAQLEPGGSEASTGWEAYKRGAFQARRGRWGLGGTGSGKSSHE